ncbi:MAG: FtsX-like permease family protein, partial [Chryseobacterium sp.]
MLKLNFKIAFRNFQRNLINSIISIGGMAVAISAFLIIILYVKYEREYDALTPNYSQIYLVGRDLKGVQSSLISAQFAQKIKETFPEIDRVGKVRYTDFEFPISNKKSRIYVKNVVSADYDAYKILDFQLDEHAFNSTAKSERTFFLSEADLNTLFPDKKDTSPELVTIGPVAAGQKGKVQGSFKPQKHTNIVFDGLAVTADIASGMDATDNAYMTFIQVKPEADVANLTLKFNRLYASDAISRDETVNPESTAHVVTLKPLRDLHLQSGSGNSAKVVNVLLWLGILVLVLACIGFVNMNIVKSTARAKEVGVKQVLGVTRVGLMMQFIIEILIQSALSAVLGLLLTEFLLPVVNTVFEVNLSIWSSSGSLFLLLILVVVFATLLASLYPSLVLSSYKPASILKGSFSKGKQVLWLQKSLLAFQFSIAVVFI